MLDPYTLLFALTATHFVSTAVLFLVWHVNRTIPGVNLWALGRLCVTLGLVAFSIRSIIEPVSSVMIGNGMLFLGLYLVWQGNRAFMNRSRTGLGLSLALYGVAMMGLMYWTLVEPSFTTRAVLVAFVIFVFDGLSIRALWPRKGDEVYFFGKVMSGAFALSAVLQIVRMVFSLYGEDERTFYDPTIATQLGLMTGILMSMISAMAHMAIIMEFLKKDLKRQAERDPLTGVYNRRAFHAVAGHVLARGRRNGDAVSLVILDLDHFKSVNDSHGHMAGDAVLKRVVNIVESVLRAQDVLVRMGGEEFAMMLPGTAQAEASQIAERIRLAIEAESFEIEAGAVRVTTSLGVTSIAAMNASHGIDDLMKRADLALYQAKDAGRNRVCVSP